MFSEAKKCPLISTKKNYKNYYYNRGGNVTKDVGNYICSVNETFIGLLIEIPSGYIIKHHMPLLLRDEK